MNRKGQAMIESLIVGIILIIGLGLFLKSFSKLQKKMFLDELTEETLICLVQNKSVCLGQLRNKLLSQGFSNIFIQTKKIQHKSILQLRATTSFNEIIEKESELEYETKLQI